jgi:hypothetical protein
MFEESHQGRLVIAQHFSAGKEMRKLRESVGTTEVSVQSSLRDSTLFYEPFPALKVLGFFQLSLRDKNLKAFHLTRKLKPLDSLSKHL